MTHGFSDIVRVSRPTNSVRNPPVLAQAAKKLHKHGGELSVFDAEILTSEKNFAVHASKKQPEEGFCFARPAARTSFVRLRFGRSRATWYFGTRIVAKSSKRELN